MTKDGRWDYETLLKWIAVLLPIYLGLRIFTFARFDMQIALEVIRQQGVSGIAEAAIASVYRQLLMVVLALAVLVVLVKFVTRNYQHQDIIESGPTRLATILLGIIALVVLPIILIGLTLLWLAVTLLLAGAPNKEDPTVRRGRVSDRRGRLILTLLWSAITLTTLYGLVDEPWLPHEQVWSAHLPDGGGGAAAASMTPYVNGYVLGRNSGTFYSVRTKAKPRELLDGRLSIDRVDVVILPDIASRALCILDRNRWTLRDGYSAITLVFGESRLCKDVSPPAMVTPSPTPTPSPGPTGSRGPRGPRGPEGREGPTGPPGPTTTVYICPSSTLAGC